MVTDSEAIHKCRVNSNKDGETFVGIKSDGKDISVCFPLGYRMGGTAKEWKLDIRNLIRVLSRFDIGKENLLPQQRFDNHETVDFPIQAYLTVISEYTSRGYYVENEVNYKKNHRGKINWSRTIKTQKAYPQNGSFLYLDFVTKDSVVDRNNFITLINEFCVYESFSKLGWLFTSAMPNPARIPFDEKRFLAAIRDKLSNTNNDKDKMLFNGMVDMIKYIGTTDNSGRFYFGTDRFEYVWEKMIDFTYGITGKNYYFPKTTWHLNNSGRRTNAALEPDTIMIIDDKIIVIDAKFYKYGDTAIPSDLPESSSINKQITYGEYIATQQKFKEKHGEDIKVYNVFLMPFNKDSHNFLSDSPLKHIGESRGSWKSSGKEYERVQGILLDVKHIMSNSLRRNAKEISSLAELFERIFIDYQ